MSSWTAIKRRMLICDSLPRKFPMIQFSEMSTTLSKRSFLCDLLAFGPEDLIAPIDCRTPSANRAVAETLQSGLPSIKQAIDGEPQTVSMCLPVYRSGRIASLAVFVGIAEANSIGVFEIWQPIGEYDELNLTHGYYGSLERFQNVSSYVRFEKGVGLPGQMWRNLSSVVHDNLPRHSGFLRAAGASAESLQVAFGIPIDDGQFLASVVLVSSDATPIARAYEVWRANGEKLMLESQAYQRLEQTLELEEGASIPIDGTLPGEAIRRGQVVISDDPAIVFSGRPYRQHGSAKGVAIPFFEDDRVTNVLSLLV